MLPSATAGALQFPPISWHGASAHAPHPPQPRETRRNLREVGGVSSSASLATTGGSLVRKTTPLFTATPVSPLAMPLPPSPLSTTAAPVPLSLSLPLSLLKPAQAGPPSRPVPTTGGQGFGAPKKGAGAGKSGKSGGSGMEHVILDQKRDIQFNSTQLLSTFLEAPDLRATVQANVDSLTEEFFLIASTYLEMAKKEGKSEVVAQLEAVLRVTMEEKEKTLRPEIRLLNQLLRDKSPSERLKTMAANNEHVVPDGYFFSLLKQLLGDVEGAGKPQEKVRTQLRLIKREAEEHARYQVKKPLN